jgi:O-antigen/teichoic acid export membrane protein
MKSILQVFTFNIISKAIMGLTGILLIRYLSLSEYASFTLAFSIMMVVTQAITVSLNRIYIVGQRNLHFSNSSSPFLGFQLLGVLILAIVAFPFVGHSGNLYWFTAAAIIASCFSEFTKTFFQEKLKFVSYSSVEICRTLLVTVGTLLGILFLGNKLAAWQVLAIQAAAMSIIFLVVFGWRIDLRGLLKINEVLILAGTIIRGQFRYLFGYFFLFSFFGQLDVFMLRSLSNDATVATYGSAFRYYTLIIMALGSAHSVLLPMTQKAKSTDELRKIFRKFTRLVFVFAPVVLIGAWASRWIIPAIDAGKYPQAVTVFRILAISAIFSFALSPHVNLVMRYEKFKFLFVAVTIAALISVVSNIFLVPLLGAVGTAISTLISFAYVNGSVYLKARRLLTQNASLPGGALGEEKLAEEATLPVISELSLREKYGSPRPYIIKLRAKVREYSKKFKPAIKVLDVDKFYAKRWRGDSPDNKYFDSRKNTIFFFGSSDKHNIIKALKRHFPQGSKAVIDRAQMAFEHTFDLLGSGPTTLGQKIDWHQDFKCGKSWPKEHYTKIQIVDPTDRSDIKVPWELSRLQFITDLGRAYWLTDDTAYKHEFKSFISDWEDANPVDVGVNWTCSMEVAIRAINIFWGLNFFSFDENEKEFVKKNIRLLYYHGLHIERNLENTAEGANSNHLISDYLGLFYIGLLIPEFKRSKRWLKLGRVGLERQMRSQVLPDGADYECSTSYHRLVLEMFLSAYLLGKKNNLEFSDDYRTRLEAMIDFSEALTPSSGIAPLVGDNDDGFVIKLSTDNPSDHRPLIDIGHISFGKRSSHDIPGTEERLWYLGPDTLSIMNDSEPQSSRHFEDSGYAIMRGQGFHLLFNAAGVPKKNFGGHKHNDLLSFTLEMDGVPYLIDPGTFCYSADYAMRNLSRSVNNHNTVVVDNAEQNRFLENRLFFLMRDASPAIKLWAKTEKSVVVSASHDGYERLDGVIHRRTITAWPDSRQIHLRDDFSGDKSKSHTYCLQFVTPILDIRRIEHASLEICGARSRGLYIRASEEGLKDLLVTPIEYFPRYGVKSPALLIKFIYRCSPPFGFSASIGLLKHQGVTVERPEFIEALV